MTSEQPHAVGGPEADAAPSRDTARDTVRKPLQGSIVRVHGKAGYGFIAAEDGRFVYFNRDSVGDTDFRQLHKGHRVWFVIAPNDCIGPRAASVHAVDIAEAKSAPASVRPGAKRRSRTA